MSRSMMITAALVCVSCGDRVVPLPDAPVVRSRAGLASMTLAATRGPNGRDAFVFDGHDVPPTIRIAPGDTLKIHYVNALPVVPETAPRNGQMNMTNLHFHGLSISPMRPQDDVLDMIAMPGERSTTRLLSRPITYRDFIGIAPIPTARGIGRSSM